VVLKEGYAGSFLHQPQAATTTEIRTQASMTMPLSSTRSSTSMRLVPPGARSTATWFALFEQG
jgi:hypothetical protein